jgi:hypothetical protein
VSRVPCEYVLDAAAGYSECGEPATEAVGYRPRLSDRWRELPVCPVHRDKIRSELGGLFVVSDVYVLGDDDAREIACPSVPDPYAPA